MEAGLLGCAPIWTDLKTFPWSDFHGKVDILTGGYPCQPFSAAGKRAGTEDPRHLWPFISAGIAAMRPSACFFENVEGHISLGLPDVIEDLAGLGYRTTWGLFSAAEVGAPHQRKRVFILAYRCESGLEGMLHHIAAQGRQDEGRSAARCGEHRGDAWPSRPGEQQHWWEPPRVVGNADHGRLASGLDAGSGSQTSGGGQSNVEQTESRQAEPPLGRDADGPASRMGYAELCLSCDNRTDELRLLGNGVVPATAERAFRTLMNELMYRR